MRKFCLFMCFVALICGCTKSESDEFIIIPAISNNESNLSQGDVQNDESNVVEGCDEIHGNLGNDNVFVVETAEIKLDGDFADWDGIDPFLVVPSEVAGRDLVRMYMVHSLANNEYVYMRVDTQLELDSNVVVDMLYPDIENDQGAFQITIKYPMYRDFAACMPVVIRHSGSVQLVNVLTEVPVGNLCLGASAPDGVEFMIPLDWFGPYITAKVGFSEYFTGEEPGGDVFITDLVEVLLD